MIRRRPIPRSKGRKKLCQECLAVLTITIALVFAVKGEERWAGSLPQKKDSTSQRIPANGKKRKDSHTTATSPRITALCPIGNESDTSSRNLAAKNLGRFDDQV